MSTVSIRHRIYRAGGVAIITLFLNAMAHAQSTDIINACSPITDKDKNLECIKELSTPVPTVPTDVASGMRAKSAFAAVADAVHAVKSLSNYSVMLLEPSKELGAFKQASPKTDQRVFDLLDESLNAYHDAEQVWLANIDNRDNNGVYRKILNPLRSGLQDIVKKYKLPIKSVASQQHLVFDDALPIIWKYAAERAATAVEILEKHNSGNTGKDTPK